MPRFNFRRLSFKKKFGFQIAKFRKKFDFCQKQWIFKKNIRATVFKEDGRAFRFLPFTSKTRTLSKKEIKLPSHGNNSWVGRYKQGWYEYNCKGPFHIMMFFYTFYFLYSCSVDCCTQFLYSIFCDRGTNLVDNLSILKWKIIESVFLHILQCKMGLIFTQTNYFIPSYNFIWWWNLI